MQNNLDSFYALISMREGDMWLLKAVWHVSDSREHFYLLILFKNFYTDQLFNNICDIWSTTHYGYIICNFRVGFPFLPSCLFL